MRAWRFSSVRSGSRPANCGAQRVLVGRHHRLDRELVGGDAERGGERAGIVLGRRRGVRRGHDRGADARRAERVGGEAGDERGVDAAGEPEHDVVEAVLAHVVAQPERQRAVDLSLVRRERLAQRAGHRARPLGARGAARQRWQHQRRVAAERRAAGRWLGSRRRAAAAACEVDVAEEQLLAELRGARDRARRCGRSRRSGRRRRARPGRRRARRRRRRRGCRGRAGRTSAHARSPCRAWYGEAEMLIEQAWRPRAPRRWPAGRAPTCPRRRVRPMRSAGEVDHRAAPRPPGNSAARRRRRSWAGTPCGRSREPRRPASTAAAL